MEVVNPSPAGRDLLGDLDEIVVLNPASQGQRFVNYLIDAAATYGISFAVQSGMEELYDLTAGVGPTIFDTPLLYVMMYSSALAYYTCMEAFFKGRTIGKLLTGTYAVGNDGQPLTLKQAFLRSLCRIVPFEVLSGLGPAPWHDKWTNTTVVKKQP